MIIKENFLTYSDGFYLTKDQCDFLDLTPLSHNLKLINRRFDSKNIDTEKDTWKLRYSGSPFLFNFNINDPYSKKLLKWTISMLLKIHSISYCYACYKAFYKFLFSSEKTLLSFDVLFKYLQSEDILKKTKEYYPLKRVISLLIEHEFPEFPLENLFKLETIPKPLLKDWEYYYQFDIKLKPDLKRFVRNGILRQIQHLNRLDYKELIYLSTLTISYESGLRPFQLFNLTVQDFKEVGTNFFELEVSTQKMTSKNKKRQVISLSPESGEILKELIKRRLCLPFNSPQLLLLDPSLTLTDKHIHIYLNEALSMLQNKFNPNMEKSTLPVITAYDFRHNVGHSLAMSGASADEIAYMLGHNSTVVARHYISATPEIAILKQKALGENNAYLDMMGLIMTGDITNEEDWSTEKVSGNIALNLVTGIGGCGAESCHFVPVRACYGCHSFYPFKDADHNHVKNLLKEEVKLLMDLSDSTGQTSRNPIINEYEQTIFEVDSVITRCKK